MKEDSEVFSIIEREETRQQDKLSLIASENFFSPQVRAAVGSVMSHKYAEGNIGQRYYEGNQYIDELESLAIERTRQLFKLPSDWGVNVQALSGSSANLAVYLALLAPGDLIMSMYLPDGGHLSHGWSYEPGKKADVNEPVYLGGSRRVNITSRLFKVVQYKTSPVTQLLNYDDLMVMAKKYKPKLLITGGTAYSRLIDYARMRDVARQVGAMYLADIAHEAGLVAAGVIPSPVTVADVVTMTTHKTLRAGRGAIILGKEDLIKKINNAVMPGLQGGPHNHNIAGLTVGLGEALKPEFVIYQRQVLANARMLAEELVKNDFKLVSGGTDKHLLLIDLTDKPVSSRYYARALDYAGLVVNFNTMPQETGSPRNPSALRIGTPWVSTRGMKEPEMIRVAGWMNEVMQITEPWASLGFDEFEKRVSESREIRRVADETRKLCHQFPLLIEQLKEDKIRA